MKNFCGRNMTIALVFLVGIIFVMPQFALPATLYAILTGDTSDDDIGDTVTKDLHSMQKEFKNIARYANMTLKLTIIDGKKLTDSQVISSLKTLMPNSDDVILFYFSGHGFRYHSKNNKWPYMKLLYDKGLDEYEVFQFLMSKNHRLLIVLTDACNNVIPEESYSIVIPKNSTSSSYNTRNYRILFRQASGTIIASSSKATEYSVALEGKGGAFTLQFINALHTELSSSSPSWNSLMELAAEPIQISSRDYQHPQYSINGQEGNSSLSQKAFSVRIAGSGNKAEIAQKAGVRSRNIQILQSGFNGIIEVPPTQYLKLLIQGSGNRVYLTHHINTSTKIDLIIQGSGNEAYLHRNLNISISNMGSGNDVQYVN